MRTAARGAEVEVVDRGKTLALKAADPNERNYAHIRAANALVVATFCVFCPYVNAKGICQKYNTGKVSDVGTVSLLFQGHYLPREIRWYFISFPNIHAEAKTCDRETNNSIKGAIVVLLAIA